jgi:uncharacterized peroxidase-related enzyme
MAQTLKTSPHVLTGVDPLQYPGLAEIEKKTGPSNFLRVMARRPEVMERFFGLYESLMMAPGTLDQRLREMIYLAASNINECDYCLHHHMKSGRKAGLTEREIGDIQTEQNHNFTERERAALNYARELTRSASVDDDDMCYAVQELFTIEQWVEITQIVALANFTNRVNNALKVEIE